MVLGVCARMILRRLECRSANSVTFGGVSLLISFPYSGSGSKSPYMFVYVSEYCVGGFVSLYYVASGCVCLVVVCDCGV